MPIEKVGDSTQLVFGRGDIEVAPALVKTDDIIGAVFFFLTEPGPIGLRNEYDPNQQVGIEETPVRMLFEKVESIDVVIRALEKTKSMMRDKLTGELRE